MFRDELIGNNIKIIKSANKKQEGCEGKIIDETLHTLKIRSKDKTMTIFKKDLVFALEKGAEKAILEGKNIYKRPEERTKGK